MSRRNEEPPALSPLVVSTELAYQLDEGSRHELALIVIASLGPAYSASVIAAARARLEELATHRDRRVADAARTALELEARR